MPRTTIPSLENSAPASPERGRAYFLGLTSLLVVLLAMQALFNYLVNPLANFRSHRGLGHMVNQRQIKVDLLHTARPRPEVLILGSSRVRNLDPARVGQAFQAPAFNAGVQNGGPRDWLVFTRYASLDLGYRLRVVLVGVDPDSFLRDTIGLNHPAYITELRRQLPHPGREWLATRQELWSPSQTKKSWEVLARRFEGKTTLSDVGYEIKLIYRELLDPPPLPKEMTPRSDGYSPETSFPKRAQIRRGLVQAFSRKTPLNQEGIEYWNDLAAFAAERGFTLVVFIIPMHPELENQLDDAGGLYRQRLDQARKLLLDARARGAIVCEIDPQTLNFNDYDDLYHPGLRSSNAIIKQVHACAQRAGGI